MKIKFFLSLFISTLSIYQSSNAQSSILTSSVTTTSPTGVQTSTVTTTSQNNNTIDFGTYVWTVNVPMIKCDFNGKTIVVATNDTIAQSLEGQNFIIYNSTLNGDYIIKIIAYNDEANFYKYCFKGADSDFKTNFKDGKDNGDYGIYQLYFRVSSQLILKYAVKSNHVNVGLAAGVLSFLYKYRGQSPNKDFSGAYNMNAAVGLTLGHKADANFTYTILGSFGIGTLNLDSSVVNKNKDKVQATNNYNVLSFAFGGMISYQKVQIGVFMGVDRLSNLNQQYFDWKFQGNPWFSIGLGYSIFTPTKVTSADSQ